MPSKSTYEMLRVSSTSDPAKLAGAIVGTFHDFKRCELVAMGAGAVNQTVKAVAIARGYAAPQGMDLAVIPSFLDVDMDGETKTAIKFQLIALR